MNNKKDTAPADLPTGRSLRSQLRTWLKEICPKQNVEDYCQIMADSATPEVMKVRVFTHDYRYSIYATSRPDDPDNLQKALLSCEATRRKSLAGLTQHTFAHLVDGQFSRVIWELIKAAILRFELVKLTAKAKELATKELETSKLLWKKLCSHYAEGGRDFYSEWLQRGEEIKDTRIYELIGTRKEGVVKKPE